jgi:3-oxoacyl-[acyl-carrier-protein] synthase II
MENTKIYINGAGIVSPQKTYDNSEFLPEIIGYSHNVLNCVVPDFKQYINPIQLRRLSRMLRIGLSAAIICTRNSGNEKVDGIITGTGYGFLNDTAKFVGEMLSQQEQHLTPTFFMQGTYNALSGLVALTLKCNGYNNTYVNKGFAFETSLHDAIMQLHNKDARSFLVGAYDEADDVQYKVNSRANHYKKEHISSLELFEHKTQGSLQGEGAAFFSLSTACGENPWGILQGVRMLFKPGSASVLLEALKEFLSRNNLSLRDVDVLVHGASGDSENDSLLSTLTENLFPQIPEVRFKHLCGEYCTASSFGLWLGLSILKKQQIPSGVQFNLAPSRESIKNVLLVNQYMGRNYSFMLLQGLAA